MKFMKKLLTLVLFYSLICVGGITVSADETPEESEEEYTYPITVESLDWTH